MYTLTNENLELLTNEYINKLNQLDTSKSINTVDFRNKGPHNRFFDIRYDNRYFNENVSLNCQHKCVCGYRIDDDERSCDCDEDCSCDFCSAETDDEIDFVHENCPEELVYEQEKMYTLHQTETYKFPEHEKEFTLHPRYSPVDPLNDKYAIRSYYMTNRQVGPTYQTKYIISLNSIPILERNLKRLKKELQRQETFKWCLAKIRARSFLNCSWGLLSDQGTIIRLSVPNDMLLCIFYWTSF